MQGIEGIELSVEELVNLRQNFSDLKLHNYRDIKSNRSGYRLSKIKGHGIDFDEVREYQFGDDIRSIDWKTSAKSQQIYSKTYKEERERPVLILADLHTQMFFGSKVALKSVILARLSVLIAYLAIAHQDKIGGVIYGASHLEIKPKSNKLGIQALIRALVYIHNQSIGLKYKNGLKHALLRTKRSIKPGSLLFILSDFSTLDESEEALITQISRHNDVILNFIYDPLERFAPPNGQYLLNDGVIHKVLSTATRKMRHRYQSIFDKKYHYLLDFCQRNRLSLMPIASDANLAETLLESLTIFKR